MKLQDADRPNASVTVYVTVVSPRLNVKLVKLLIPSEGDEAVVAPVITQVRVTTLSLGSEYMAARPSVISISQVVALVFVIIGLGQLIDGAILLRVTITSLLIAVTLPIPGSRPVTVATFLIRPAATSAGVTICCPVQVTCSPGASVNGSFAHVTSAIGSSIDTPVSVTFPVFVTVKV